MFARRMLLAVFPYITMSNDAEPREGTRHLKAGFRIVATRNQIESTLRRGKLYCDLN